MTVTGTGKVEVLRESEDDDLYFTLEKVCNGRLL